MVRDDPRATTVSEDLRGEERLTRGIPNFISRPRLPRWNDSLAL
jgi:hypothetical protein